MTTDTNALASSPFSEESCSALVTLSTPECPTPICRLGTAQKVIGDLTVRQLVERAISPTSPMSLDVPPSQLDAEAPTALAVRELLLSGRFEVVLMGDGLMGERVLGPDEPLASVAEAQLSSQGTAFMNLALEIRPTEKAADLPGEDRRLLAVPEPMEAETPPAQEPAAVAAAPSPIGFEEERLPVEMALAPEPAAGREESASESPDSRIIAIVAEPGQRPAEAVPSGKKEYVRKADVLRAQFLPEVEALDLSGLFVGNLGPGIRQQQARRSVILADPSRITELLLRGNSYRRNGEHAKALICYQELADMDPANADFRFLLGKTLLALGQREAGTEALTRARELGHEGARAELQALQPTATRTRRPLSFLRFWRQ